MPGRSPPSAVGLDRSPTSSSRWPRGIRSWCTYTLVEELGASPGPDTEALYLAVLAPTGK